MKIHIESKVGKMEIKYTWDSELMIQRIKCFFRHKWDVNQVTFQANDGDKTLVLAWKTCERCCKTKLIHILK